MELINARLRTSFVLNHSWERLWSFQEPHFILSASFSLFTTLLTFQTESHSGSKLVQKHCSAFRDACPCLLLSHTTRENADLLMEWERIDWFSVGCHDFTPKHAAITIYFCQYPRLPRDSPSHLHSHPSLSYLLFCFVSLFLSLGLALVLCMCLCLLCSFTLLI